MSLSTSTPAQGIPALSEPATSSSGGTTPRAHSTTATTTEEKKAKKRSLFGFGKKKESEQSTSTPFSISRNTPAAPIQTDRHHPIPGPSSPFASSPRLSSPAGSQIFERDVQESATSVVMPNSPAIPSHIQTENFIPPVLDASSEAITDNHLDPDNVEIITHQRVYEPSWTEELAAFSLDRNNTHHADSASNYGSLDTTDVRRLSFISFADVVQSEQAIGPAGRESMHIAGLTSLNLHGNNRSPSPIRSPVSSAGGPGTSPPTSKSGSVKGLDIGGVTGSPSRIGKPLGSPTGLVLPSILPTVGGELAIETMSQALRRTGSGDLRGPGLASASVVGLGASPI